jgi:hypothetical protein
VERLPFSAGATLALAWALCALTGASQERLSLDFADLRRALTSGATMRRPAQTAPSSLDAEAALTLAEKSPGVLERPAAATRPSLGEVSPEAGVQQAYELARGGHGSEAVAMIEAVLIDAPQFRPALSLQGLLAAEWTQAAADADDDRPPARRLQPPQALTEENALRWAAQRHRATYQQQVPSNLLQLGPEVHTVLAADLAESRLYWLSHDQRGLWLRNDYYLSTGMRGSYKQNPGDQRTPIGIYALQHRLPDSMLPALAGHAAWPLAFPNRWDQWQGHLGSGIWLHGSAPGQYDGLPHSTNGCLALSNGDIDRLATELASAGTILLVAEHLDWITPANLRQRRSSALQRLQARGGAAAQPAAGDSLYAYPGEPELLLVRRADGSAHPQDQFWPSGALESLPSAHS